MASRTRWTWVWVNSGSWWWTGRPGVLRFMGSQRVGHDWMTELNWYGNSFSLSDISLSVMSSWFIHVVTNGRISFFPIKSSHVIHLCPTLQPYGWVAHETSLFKVFSKQEYWSGLPFPFPGDLPNTEIKPRSPDLQADSLCLSLQGSLLFYGWITFHCMYVEFIRSSTDRHLGVSIFWLLYIMLQCTCRGIYIFELVFWVFLINSRSGIAVWYGSSIFNF